MDVVLTQLTDIHISCSNDVDILRSRVDSITGAIATTIRKANSTMLFLCVTGDIAYSGTREQYEYAKTFFDELYEKLMIRYSDMTINYVFIPGNHDCDFSDANSTVRNTLITNPNIDMSDDNTISICTSIQNNYFEFVQEYINRGIAFSTIPNRIFTENVISDERLGKTKIFFHLFNTAWCSKLKETTDMKLFVPEGIEDKASCDIVVTLMHHGMEWFGYTAKDVWEKYHKRFSDVIFIGHDHTMDFVHSINYDKSTNYFIKGNQLYSAELPDQSGFNVLKISIEDSVDEDVETFYTYSWDADKKLYCRLGNIRQEKFVRNKFKNSKCSIKDEAKRWLDEIEIDISCRYKPVISLSDIYVYPVMQADLEKKEKYTMLHEESEIIDAIEYRRYIVVDGAKEFGKTALLKRLFIKYYEEEKYPIIISGSSIRSADEPVIDTLIRETYGELYENIQIEELLQFEKDKRICLIDDFDSIYLSDKTQKKFLEIITSQFGVVVITCNKKNKIVDGVRNLETTDYINNNFYEFEICPLRRHMKSKIVEKWLLLEDPSQDTNTVEFDKKMREKMDQIQIIIRSGYFSNTPIEFLLILSYLDTGNTNTDYSRYSYIYDCLIRDKINEVAGNDTKTCLAYRTLLEILAYMLYENKEGALFDEDYVLLAIKRYEEDYPPFKVGCVMVIKKLVEAKILEQKTDKIKFKHNYMYYYFVGSYIDDILPQDEKEAFIKDIISDLSLDLNYNIALFMAFRMNTEYSILPAIKGQSEQLLKEFKDFKYEDQKELLSKVNANVMDKVNLIYQIPENEVIPEIQKKRRIHQDDLDQIEFEGKEALKETEERAKRNFDVIFKNFAKLLRLIQFSGDVLKNYSTKIKNDPRHEMIEIMGASNLKLIGFLCDMVSIETDKIIELVETRAKMEAEDGQLNKQALIQLISDYIGILWTQFIEINVDNLAICLDCDLLKDDVLQYKTKMDSNFFDMVYIEYLLEISDGRLPVTEIKNSITGKKKMDSFSRKILEHIIAGYLMNNQYDQNDKASVCEMLHFDYKKMYIEEKKRVTQGLIGD